MSGTTCKNVSVSGDVRRPNGNGRPSAFSYKSFHFFSVILSHSDQTPLQSRTVGGFHQGRAASIHEHTHANKGSDSQRGGQIRMTSAGTFQNLALQTVFMRFNDTKRRSQCSNTERALKNSTSVIIYSIIYSECSSSSFSCNKRGKAKKRLINVLHMTSVHLVIAKEVCFCVPQKKKNIRVNT